MGYPAGLPPPAIPSSLHPHAETRERCSLGPAVNMMVQLVMTLIKWRAHGRICIQKFVSCPDIHYYKSKVSTLMAHLRKSGTNKEEVNLTCAGYAVYCCQELPALPLYLTEHMPTSLNASASIVTRRGLCAALMASLLLQFCASSASVATTVMSASVRHSPHGEPRPAH